MKLIKVRKLIKLIKLMKLIILLTLKFQITYCNVHNIKLLPFFMITKNYPTQNDPKTSQYDRSGGQTFCGRKVYIYLNLTATKSSKFFLFFFLNRKKLKTFWDSFRKLYWKCYMWQLLTFVFGSFELTFDTPIPKRRPPSPLEMNFSKILFFDFITFFTKNMTKTQKFGNPNSLFDPEVFSLTSKRCGR